MLLKGKTGPLRVNKLPRNRHENLSYVSLYLRLKFKENQLSSLDLNASAVHSAEAQSFLKNKSINRKRTDPETYRLSAMRLPTRPGHRGVDQRFCILFNTNYGFTTRFGFL
ncbi:hypothetical protein AVEN_168978-1 [Araneus ventricosus]|uniref:Uncharacterized protein n=1 Tax=Araneus ventricosus TaxID=182803 RepID=A0A4Y2WMV2_ARAVE|nr:hypothetical protein AVEN_241929-1 [Araneus ventricosus]GBO38839.1 hypothetical protein AVEN_90533-1 [Araneus ventricosus]GBO38842.1 hypothetical protein AVEN_119786-1 [Araneus ventricosus]GBO38844.1 hypothetical protein AVEN_168978-1 [Araneus ventricosus]